MAYIKDVFHEASLAFNTAFNNDYLTPKSMGYSDFTPLDDAEYFRFKVCDQFTFRAKYAFDHLFDPNLEFDDQAFVERYESYSPIFISGNKGPMLFIANNFTQNIGTVGGVINI